MYFFVEPNAATALNEVMMSHLVLYVSNTRKYVKAVLTRIQGKLCDKNLYCLVVHTHFCSDVGEY